LDENDALLLKANQQYEDLQSKTKYNPWDKWMLRWPREFILPLELEIIERRRAIPLDDNEGIYVRDVTSGNIKIITW